MPVQLGRIVRHVHDIERLSAFYREAFAFALVPAGAPCDGRDPEGNVFQLAESVAND
ncbi:hypothetical protein MXD81_19000 [Microbacteriaceae bacterium K1510]|nr:hypothetical protein [Microbacteriaceae bacterium K1510]